MTTLEEKIAEIDAVLDAYEDKAGLPTNTNPNAELVKEYLRMPKDQLSKLAPMDCDEMVVVLSSYSLYVQRMLNREMANNNWATETLKYYTCDKTNQYHGSFTQQENQVVKNDEYALKIKKLIMASKQRIDTLSFLSANIKNIADSLKSLAQGKRYRNA